MPAWPLLAALCAASATVVVILGTKLSFFNDDWHFLLHRPGLRAETIFEPYNGHLSAGPVLAYKALIGLFGLDGQLPFRLAIAAALVGLAIAVFAFVRERLGNVTALAAAALLLFLGPAWEVLLFFASINLLSSLLAGVCVLSLLERDSRRRNLAACALLVVAVAISNLGLAFVVAAAVAVLLRRRPAQIWIPGVPAAAFALWWASYRSEVGAATDLSLDNVARAPAYVLDSIASGLAALTGLTHTATGGSDPSAWGRPLLALAAIGIGVWLYRGARPSRHSAVIVTAALTFWALAGADFTPGDEPQASRYQLVSATLLILLAAELFRSASLPRVVPGSIAVVTVLAIGSNLAVLGDGYDLLRREALLANAELGALDIVRGSVGEDFQLTPEIAGTQYLGAVLAGPYYRESDAHGSPAFTPAEIALAPPDVRQAADRVLAAGYGLGLAPYAGSPTAVGADRCRRLKPVSAGGSADLELGPGSAEIVNLGPSPVTIALRRFAPPGFSVDLGSIGVGRRAGLEVPADSVRVPWKLTATGAPVALCS